MKPALVLLLSLLSLISVNGADPVAELDAAFKKDWGWINVGVRIYEGCILTGPVAVQIKRGDKGLQVANFEYAEGKDPLGKSRALPDYTKESLEALILSHIKTAAGADDVHEYVAKLPTEKEKKKAWGRMIKRFGTPFGGYGNSTMIVEVGVDGREVSFKNNFGDKPSTDAFSRWIDSLRKGSGK